MTKQKITLALGGGGLKGYAHLGVIAALEENGYEIAAIAGTSAGGLFGSFFAYGYSFQEILSFIDELDNSRLFQRLHSDPPSLIGLKGVYEILNDKFKGHSISSMKIPCGGRQHQPRGLSELWKNKRCYPGNHRYPRRISLSKNGFANARGWGCS